MEQMTPELSNYEEARGLVTMLTANGIPVRPGDDEIDPVPREEDSRPGIYRPLWTPGVASPEPQYTDELGVKYWRLELMMQGHQGGGQNVGMLLARLRKDPWHRQAVYDEIKRDLLPES